MNIDKYSLQPGMILGKDIYIGNSKVPLLTKGEELDERKINYLMHLVEIDKINVSLIGKEVNSPVGHDLREMALNAIKSRDIDRVVNYAKRITNAIPDNNYSYSLLKYALENITLDEMTLDICEFAVAFGKVYNQHADKTDRIDLDDLAIAAMLHNAGAYYRKHIDEIAKLPITPLSKKFFPNFDIRAFLVDNKKDYSPKYEPVYAYALLKNVTNINHDSKVAILLQYESENGKGPLGFTFNSINKKGEVMAQIIYIASLYERFLIAVVNDPSKKPSAVITGMMNAANTGMVNKSLVNLFLKNISLFSIGTRVILNDGTIAEVIDNNAEPEFPVVKIESNIHGVASMYNDGTIIDLSFYKEKLYITGIYDFGLKEKITENKNVSVK